MKENFLYNNPPLLLLKFTRKIFIDDIINNGRFYLTRASYFRECALNNDKSLIYDIDECSRTRKIHTYLKFGDTYYPAFNDKYGHVAVNMNQCLFCTYSVNHCIYNWNEEKKCYYIVIEPNVISELTNGYDVENYGLIVFDHPYKTLNKIHSELINKDLNGAIGFVVYDDNDYIPKNNISEIEYAFEAAFHKRKNYKNNLCPKHKF